MGRQRLDQVVANLVVTNQPAYSKDETSKYTDRDADGRAAMFTFEMGVKSVITSPSLQLDMGRHGVYQVSGLAWSGAGRIKSVEVSADGGKTWAPAALDSEAKSKSLTRFGYRCKWSGQPLDLVSRATDERGAVQPTRAEALKGRGRRVLSLQRHASVACRQRRKVSHVYV